MPVSTTPLNVLVVGDSIMADSVARRWQAEGRGEANVSEITSAQWSELDFVIEPQIDVVVFPASFQADAVARNRVLEIPSEIWLGEEINKNELLHHFRSTLTRNGTKVFTLPLGAPQWMLVYRADVLTAINAKVPQTWDELDALIANLKGQTDLKDGEGNPLPTLFAQPLGDNWAAHMLLARVASAISGHGRLSTVCDMETMKPLIDTPPFVFALDKMRAAQPPSDGSDKSPSLAAPADVYRALAEGQAAIGITWPSAQFVKESTPASRNLRIARLPGSKQWFDQSQQAWTDRQPDEQVNVDYLGFGGSVAAVSRNSLHASASLQFISWLCNKRTNLQISTQLMEAGPMRSSQLADPTRWCGESLAPEAGEEYARLISATHESRTVFTFPRIAGQQEYLGELSSACRAFVTGASGSQTAESTLQSVAEKWDSLTQKHGGPAAQSLRLRTAEGF
jgi:multiple sugar transport system substrate-binding protein